MVKKLIDKYLKHFSYFYSYLRYRMFVALGVSICVGALDGFGLAMFLPLLQMVDGNHGVNPESLGNLRFLVDGMAGLGIGMTISSVLLVILFFMILKGAARFVEAYYKMTLSRFFIKNLRFQNIDKLSNYSYKAFVSADVGRIQNTLSGEVTKVLNAYRSYFTTVQAGVMVSVYVFLAFLANAEFAVIVVVGAVLSNLFYRRIYNRTKENSRKVTKGAHKFQALLIQKVAFFKYLKATGLINLYALKLKKTILEIEETTKKMGWHNAILSSTKEPVIVTVVVCVILIQVVYLSKSLGLIILSLLFFYRSLTFLMNLQTQWNNFLNVSGSLDNMQDFMKELRAHQEVTGTLAVTQFKDKLELTNACFSYSHNHVLNNINLVVRKNETVAFVGESGSGKTTMVNILAGLMPLNKGNFLIDGIDSREVSMETYQKRIGYITQEPVIFSDSIFNNVTFWAEKNPANLDRFWKALHKASIDTFVETLSSREDSLLGNNGILISGGQKQRISIARELYKDIDILIMDEATSALDSETERTIQKHMDNLKGAYTILIVAHRLATIKNADRVVLLNSGTIESIGSFHELKTNSKLFEKMVGLQEV
jgi:ABC-type multidrug transport system fused ATPase/permease subunit